MQEVWVHTTRHADIIYLALKFRPAPRRLDARHITQVRPTDGWTLARVPDFRGPLQPGGRRSAKLFTFKQCSGALIDAQLQTSRGRDRRQAGRVPPKGDTQQ